MLYNGDIYTKFQSTLPRRERLGIIIIAKHYCIISIHTPTKGATIRCGVTVLYFKRFQSTLPRRERLISIICFFLIKDFNPHSHEGSDMQVNRRLSQFKISIHTPTKGATAILTNNFLIFCSISLINFILYLQIIQILFIVRYKFIFYFIF